MERPGLTRHAADTVYGRVWLGVGMLNERVSVLRIVVLASDF